MAIEANDWDEDESGLGIAIRDSDSPGGFRAWLACRHVAPSWFAHGAELQGRGVMIFHADLMRATGPGVERKWCCFTMEPGNRVTVHGDDVDLAERVIEADPRLAGSDDGWRFERNGV